MDASFAVSVPFYRHGPHPLSPLSLSQPFYSDEYAHGTGARRMVHSGRRPLRWPLYPCQSRGGAKSRRWTSVRAGARSRHSFYSSCVQLIETTTSADMVSRTSEPSTHRLWSVSEYSNYYIQALPSKSRKRWNSMSMFSKTYSSAPCQTHANLLVIS